MSTIKIAISIDRDLLTEIDKMIKAKVYPNRSQAIQSAIHEKLSRMNHSRLVQECAKLDAKFEQALAEEGMSTELSEWPEY